MLQYLLQMVVAVEGNETKVSLLSFFYTEQVTMGGAV